MNRASLTRAAGERSYLPPLRFAALTRYYDSLVHLTIREALWRPRLVEQAGIGPGHHVLELGSGTGTLTLLLKDAAPEAQVVGLDADEQALAIARRKAERAGADVQFRHGLIEEARFAPGSFDRVVSSLVFHHLMPEVKRGALEHAYQWLRPGGEIHIADWGRAGSLGMRLAFLGVQLLDGFASTRDHARTGLAPLLREAGFRRVRETHRQRTALGVISLHRGERA